MHAKLEGVGSSECVPIDRNVQAGALSDVGANPFNRYLPPSVSRVIVCRTILFTRTRPV